jgi:hypothetical protein
MTDSSGHVFIDAGPLGYLPSNFDPSNLSLTEAGAPEGGYSFTSAPDVTISTNCTFASTGWPCLPAPVTIQMSASPWTNGEAWLFVMNSFKLDAGSQLNLINAPKPVIFAVLDSVRIDGDLEASAQQGVAGPGGWSWSTVAMGGPSGPGGGGGGSGAYAGGGSYCGVGGGAYSPLTGGLGALGGSTYGNPTLVPLVPGSPGGACENPTSCSLAAGFGAGGGALQISAGHDITVSTVGIIAASGGGWMPAAGRAVRSCSRRPRSPSRDTSAPTAGVAEILPTRREPTRRRTERLPPGRQALVEVEVEARARTRTVRQVSIATQAPPWALAAEGRPTYGFNTQTGAASITGVLSPDPMMTCMFQGELTY